MSKYQTQIILSIVLMLLALVAAKLLGFLGFALSGAGHGSGVFGYLFYSPVIRVQGVWVSGGLIVWPAIGLLLPWAKNTYITCLVLLLMGISYTGIIRDIMADIEEAGTTSYALKTIKESPHFVVPIVSVFLLVQFAIIGFLFFLRWKTKLAKLGTQECHS